MPQAGDSRPDLSTPTALPAALPAGAPTWIRYRDNLARHLIGIARDLQLRLMGELADRGHAHLRPSFGLLITLVAREPRPLSRLARALAISPQATSQLVALAERGGYLARRSDPRDRRASWPVLTSAGERLVADAVAALRAIEVEHERRVGAAEARRFREALARLAASDADGESRDPTPSKASLVAAGPVHASIGLLPILAARLEQDLMRATGLRGHAGLKLSHGQILTLVGPAGVRLHRLAQLHRVSRQAISATAQDLEALGYLRRDADPVDRRGVVVRLTARGARLIEDSVGALDDLERGWQARLTPDAYAVFTDVARRLYGALELESAILSDAFDATGPAPSVTSSPFASPFASPVTSLASSFASSSASAEAAPTAAGRDDLARLAERLRLRLGSRDAARLAAHLTAEAGTPDRQPLPFARIPRGIPT